MKRIIVTTTINAPTTATLRFVQNQNWTVIVAGDKKTPHEEYQKLATQYPNLIYLDPETQEKKYPDLSAVIGWGTIQRRNVGYAEAYNMGADIIATVDDDNIPYSFWGEDLIVDGNVDVDVYDSNAVFDPLSVTNHNYLWHRGYPLSLAKTKNNVTYMGKQNVYVGVQADLWDGDPDIDAFQRITITPNVKFNIEHPYMGMVLSPFNSQNTFLCRDAFPNYCVLPFVGRMDDIFAGYMLQILQPTLNVVYNKASVFQARNDHNLITDLKKEYIGYEKVLEWIDVLHYSGGKLDELTNVVPKETVDFIKIYRKSFNKYAA